MRFVPDDIRRKKHVVGTKQTLRAVETKRALTVYLAEDASDYMKNVVTEACNTHGAEIEIVPSMKELGSSCGISRNAVCAAIIKE